MVKENGGKVNGVVEFKGVAREGSSELRARPVVEVPQQQSQGSTVCWQRFLNIRSLKVLLVEYDDSTRHVVAALLRNCSYEVIEAANGIQAWKVLEDLSNHIDIVLTEVVMPCLSGIALLCKIMSHKSRKNVPVIMMSSHDSMGLVFRCLSKGAVDFLVKPIRKNELKNLWQHVWRRCQSSSGSGSESGTQTQKSVRSRSVNRSNNNTGSNDEDENWSNGQNAGDGSDSGSGAQSSWTKQAVEVDSPQPEASWDHIPDGPDSTCAQVIHSNAEMCGDKQVHVTAAIDCQKEEKLENVDKHKDHEIGKHRNLDVQLEYPVEVPIKVVGSKQASQLEIDSRKFDKEINGGQLDLNNENPLGELQCVTANVTGISANGTDPQINSTEAEAPYRASNVSDNNTLKESKESSLLDPSLKRGRGVKDTGKEIQDDRNVLRRSDSSAFSRYNTASNTIKVPTGNVGSNSLHGNSSEIIKQEPVCIIRSCSSEDPPNQCSAGGSNNADMGSTTNNAFSKPEVTKHKMVAMCADKPLHQSDAFQQPLKNNSVSFSHLQLLDKTNSSITVCAPTRGTHPVLQVQHLHHCDHSHSLLHKQQLPSGHDEDKMAASLPHCGSSNMFPSPVEANGGNYSINGSASGSNNGCNGQNGSCGGVNPGGANGESDNGIAGKSGSGSGSGDGSGSGTGNGVDQDKAARRIAALNKFRQKRKERCFRRKVRYQSRKKLAEQRPRVRGQFVRKMSNESTSATNESTSGDTDK